jgi:parallel beta-helix repeat protein
MKTTQITIWVVLLLLFFSAVMVSNYTTDTASGTNVSGNINSDKVWKLSKSPFIVKGDITVKKDVTLTIEPGVVVKFDGYYDLEVQGTLIAKGDHWAGKNITFTSNKGTPKAGDWKEIFITANPFQTTSNIANCSISYADSAFNFKATTNHMVERCRIDNVNVGLRMLRGRLNTIRNSTISADTDGLVLKKSHNNKLRLMNITAKQTGIYLEDSNHNKIRNNNVSECKFGITLKTSTKNVMTFNDIYRSKKFGLTLDNSDDNRIDRNNFLFNSKQLKNQSSTNDWVNEREGYIGNYWSDYTGKDNGAGNRVAGDNIGDTKLPHQGVDWYPVMTKNGWENYIPKIDLISPNGGEIWRGVQSILWNATDLDNDDLFIEIFYKLNKTSNWSILVNGLNNTGEYIWDTTLFNDSANYLIKVKASDLRSNAEDQSESVFIVDNTPPEFVITYNNLTWVLDVRGIDNLDPDVEVTYWNITNKTNNKSNGGKSWWGKSQGKGKNQGKGNSGKSSIKSSNTWVTRCYLLTDNAGNNLTLYLELKENYGHWLNHIQVQILNISYNENGTIILPKNQYDLVFHTTKGFGNSKKHTGNLTFLIQNVKFKGDFKIVTLYHNISCYGKSTHMKDKTMMFITDESLTSWKQKLFTAKKLLLNGLYIVDLVSDNGEIKYRY